MGYEIVNMEITEEDRLVTAAGGILRRTWQVVVVATVTAESPSEVLADIEARLAREQ